jgi:hypothetical protein
MTVIFQYYKKTKMIVKSNFDKSGLLIKNNINIIRIEEILIGNTYKNYSWN